MRLTAMTICLMWTAGSASFAEEDEATAVYDFGDGGQVVVYDHGTAVAAAGGGGVSVVPGDPGPPPTEFWYYGAHPDGQGGWCQLQGAHAHEYAPFDEYLYTQENGYYYFIGDPSDFGYADNSLYDYYGPHPVATAYGGGYCFYGGFHHHFWPAWNAYFVLTNGWYFYQGPFSPWFFHYRPTYDRYFHDVYPSRRVTYGRPVHYGHPPAPQPPVQVAQPIQRMRTPGAPALAGFAYVPPRRPVMVRPQMPPRPVYAMPARITPTGRVMPPPGRVAPPVYAHPAAPAAAPRPAAAPAHAAPPATRRH
jgi:hypothetical protein